MGFGNGNSYDLALSCSRICVCLWRGNLSVGNLKSHLTKIRTYHLFPPWCPSRFANQMCIGPIAARDFVGQVFLYQ